ncbi:MAG: cobalamin ECF transporter, partial [Streptococcus parasanguinis]
MLKKTISSLMTLLAALLLASCASSHSTNHQTTASSTEVAKKNEILITISVTPEGQKAQSKTLKVAEE